MADKFLVTLPPGTDMGADDLMYGEQDGNSRQLTNAQVLARAAIKANNLSDLPDPSAARANLEVYSQAQVDALVVGLLDFKGDLDCSANPNYPAALKGDSYLVSVGGKIGGAAGEVVAMGDLIVASADNAGGTEAAVGASWFVLEKNFDGALLPGDVATFAQYRDNTADKLLDTDAVWDAAEVVALVPGANIALDLDSGFNFTLAMGGDYILDNPTNAKVGQVGCIEVTQDATGSRLLTFDTDYVFTNAIDVALSTGANALDLLFYRVLSDGRVFVTKGGASIG